MVVASEKFRSQKRQRETKKGHGPTLKRPSFSLLLPFPPPPFHPNSQGERRRHHQTFAVCMPTPPPPLPFFRHSAEPLLPQGLLFFCAEKGRVGVDEEVVWAWAAAALGQRLGGSVSSFSLLLNVPHPPNWKKKGEGTFSQTPPFLLP